MSVAENVNNRRVHWALVGLAVYGIAVLSIVLLPVGYSDIVGAVSDWIQRIPGVAAFGSGWVEFGANILMFVPLGLLLTLFFRHPWRGVVLALLLSVGVEVVQFVIPSRQPSVRDVLANVLGAGLGAFLAWAIVIRRERRRERVTVATQPLVPPAE
ncbi:MAG: VanZ family protein [Microthrixaceae bacterium]|nr:VanZ family protein [Microthrixaceae bacterium]